MLVADVIFREDLYPRIEKNAVAVQQYAESLENLPPIEVNQRGELIDGWHRWTAHRKMEAVEISAIVTETANEVEFLELAIERNASHGLQLSQTEKKAMARRIYHGTLESERAAKRIELARILSIPERTVRRWLSRIDKDAKEARNERIYDLWLACYTQEEIAEKENISREAVTKVCEGLGTFGHLAKSTQIAASYADTDPVIYNVWKQQTKSEGISHFGNTETAFVDRLLYLYTKPFEIIVDLFAGSGSTIDVAKRRSRRYWVSDRKPIVEREDEIRKHDITKGLPRLSWKDVSLIYLDPPYWRQAEGRYSNAKSDLGNMSLDEFNKALSKLITSLAKRMRKGAHIAMIMQPTQWKADDKAFTDHAADMIRAVDLPIDQRVQAPYESQQCTAQMVEWAKEHRKLLVLSREIVIWTT